jgi:hypothetical protein
MREQRDFDTLAVNSQCFAPVILTSTVDSHSSTPYILVSSEFPYRIYDASGDFAKHVQFKKEDLVASTLRLIAGPKTDFGALSKIVDQVVNNENLLQFADISLYRKDGQEIPCKMTFKHVKLSGECACLFTLHLEEKGVQVWSSNESITQIDEKAQLLISSVAPYRILEATPSFQRASGFKNSELLAASIQLLSGPETCFASVLRNETEGLVLYRRDGDPLAGSARCIPSDPMRVLSSADPADYVISFVANGAIATDSVPNHSDDHAAVFPASPPKQHIQPLAMAAAHPTAPIAPAADSPAASVPLWVLQHARRAREAALAERRRSAAA